MNKKIAIITSVIVSLGICWGIGQFINRSEGEKRGEERESGNEVSVAENELKDFVWETVTFPDAKEMEDNPWGINSGWFEMEGEGSCIFLTPNTSVQFEVGRRDLVVSFAYKIHPWVRDVSDGMGIVLWVMDDQEKVIHDETFSVDSSDEWRKFELDLQQWETAAKIKIMANNGNNADDNGDWLVIKPDNQTGTDDLIFNGDKVLTKNEDAFSILKISGVGGGDEKEYYQLMEYSDDVLLDSGIDWDSIDVLNPSVLFWNEKYYNYYSGWDGEVWRTGLATSSDGLHWDKRDKCVLDVREDNWDNSYIAANGSAIAINDKMYYYYQGMDNSSYYSQIGLAISENGEEFTHRMSKPVVQVGGVNEWDECGVADPYVISFGGNYYMYYLGMDKIGIQRLGIAMSTDGISWVKYNNNPIMDVGILGAFDENGLGEPSVIYKAPYFYMLYTGRNSLEQRNIGVAISHDGINWKKLNYSGIIDLEANIWDNQVVCDTSMFKQEDGNVRVWYGGGNVATPAENLNGKIGSFVISFLGKDFVGFDVDNWDDEFADFEDYVIGSYSIDGEEGNKSAWVTNDMEVVLKNDVNKDKLSISGYVNMELFETLGIDSFSIDFYINGEKVENLIAEDSMPFTKTINKMDFDDEYLILGIKASNYVNPKNAGIGEDERDLSWLLKSILQE